jgi:hypothetical protein
MAKFIGLGEERIQPLQQQGQGQEQQAQQPKQLSARDKLMRSLERVQGNEQHFAGQREGDIADQMIGALAGKSPALAGLVFGLKLLFGQSDKEKNLIDTQVRQAQGREKQIYGELDNLQKMEAQQAKNAEWYRQQDYRQEDALELARARGSGGATAGQTFDAERFSRQFPHLKTPSDVLDEVATLDTQIAEMRKQAGGLGLDFNPEELEALKDRRRDALAWGKLIAKIGQQGGQQQGGPAMPPQQQVDRQSQAMGAGNTQSDNALEYNFRRLSNLILNPDTDYATKLWAFDQLHSTLGTAKPPQTDVQTSGVGTPTGQ